MPGEHQSLTISDINFQNFPKLVFEILKPDFSHFLGTFRLPCFAQKAGIALSELIDLHTVVRHMGQVQTLKPETKFSDECETTARKSRDVNGKW